MESLYEYGVTVRPAWTEAPAQDVISPFGFFLIDDEGGPESQSPDDCVLLSAEMSNGIRALFPAWADGRAVALIQSQLFLEMVSKANDFSVRGLQTEEEWRGCSLALSMEPCPRLARENVPGWSGPGTRLAPHYKLVLRPLDKSNCRLTVLASPRDPLSVVRMRLAAAFDIRDSSMHFIHNGREVDYNSPVSCHAIRRSRRATDERPQVIAMSLQIGDDQLKVDKNVLNRTFSYIRTRGAARKLVRALRAHVPSNSAREVILTFLV